MELIQIAQVIFGCTMFIVLWALFFALILALEQAKHLGEL
jgi:hypothetical protein